MDIVSNLPVEIALQIFQQLSAEDLWSCMSVSRRWRLLANSDALWDKHFNRYDLKAEDFEDYIAGVNTFNLCLSCKKWAVVSSCVKNWKCFNLRKFDFPGSFHDPVFFQHYGNKIVALENFCRLKIFTLMESGLHLTKLINIPIKGTCPFIMLLEDISYIHINKKYLVLISCNLIITYLCRRDSFSLRSILQLNSRGDLGFISDHSRQFRLDSLSYTGSSHLYENMLWVSSSNGNEEHHHLVNLHLSQITKLSLPMNEMVFNCVGVCDKMIVEYQSDIAIYDMQGNQVFSKSFDFDYLEVGFNEKILVVFSASKISIIDLMTGADMVEIPNDHYYMASVLCVHPKHNVVYLTRLGLHENIIVSAFSVSQGEKYLLWETSVNKKSNERFLDKYNFFYGVYLAILMCPKSFSNFTNKLYLIDTGTGEVTHHRFNYNVAGFKNNSLITVGKKNCYTLLC